MNASAYRFACAIALHGALMGLFCFALEAQEPPDTPASSEIPGGDVEGVVKSGNVTLPGVSVSAANTLSGQKTVTSTDVDGAYALHVTANGRYVIRAELAAFAASTQEVVINVAHPSARADFDLLLLSRVQQASREEQQRATQAGPGQFQRLEATAAGNTRASDPFAGTAGSDAGAAGLSALGAGNDAATESVSISGATARADASLLNSNEIQARTQEFRDQQENLRVGGGGRGGEGERGGGPGGPFLIFAQGGKFNFNKPHGSLYYTQDNSALDAAPFALNGTSLKPSYDQNNFGGILGGPLNIPGIYHGGQKTFFFMNYNGSHSENPFDEFSTVPTLDERAGNFSSAVISSGPNKGAPVVIYNPQTNAPFPNDTISSPDPTAQALLNFIPKPNLTGAFNNFHFVTSAAKSADAVNFRVIHNFSGGLPFGPGGGGRNGPRHNLNFAFRYQRTDSALTNPFPSVAGNASVQGLEVSAGYVRTFRKITNNLRFEYNRNHSSTRNLYAFLQNVAGGSGVTGISQNPFTWGLPNLSFTQFASVNDINPLLQRDQTFSLSESLILTRGKHTFRWGGDFRRLYRDTQTDSNPRGTFTFNGAATAHIVGGVPDRSTGSDFADFLLGLPQSASVQFDNNSYHFRGNSWDLFAEDEWRVRGSLTLDLGLRYEYVSPYAEANHLLVNLDIAPGFTAVAPVLPGQSGPYSGAFPGTLVNPDRNNLAPRIGIAWKPLKNTVVRTGYGINYNTSAYGSIAQRLGFQPPFSFTEFNSASAAQPLALESAFPPPAGGVITNNYGVDRNYRLGYVQLWNLNVQQQVRPSVFFNADYTGSKGTHLDILQAPNRAPGGGLLIPGVQPFLWETSNGDSIYHGGTIRLRKRLQRGVSIGGSYTYSKSIDNASSIGGGTAVVAQNPFDLAAERGLSTFDQRHRFTADYLWELPFGHDRRWLKQNGLRRAALGDWQWSGNWTIASGTPFTARILGDKSEIVQGTNGSLRADIVPGQPVKLSNPTLGEWFNTNAFAIPPPGQFGNAGRDTIAGPGTLMFDMGLTKVVPLGDVRVLEIRGQASNVFNHPQFTMIDTVVNSPTFGRVIAAGSMRKIQMSLRFRF